MDRIHYVWEYDIEKTFLPHAKGTQYFNTSGRVCHARMCWSLHQLRRTSVKTFIVKLHKCLYTVGILLEQYEIQPRLNQQRFFFKLSEKSLAINNTCLDEDNV